MVVEAVKNILKLKLTCDILWRIYILILTKKGKPKTV